MALYMRQGSLDGRVAHRLVISYGPPPTYDRTMTRTHNFDIDHYIELLKGDEFPGEFSFFWWNDTDASKVVFDFTDENAAFLFRLRIS